MKRTFSMQKRMSRSNGLDVNVSERSEPGAGIELRDPEVVERAMRRRFGAEYKLRILKLADSCTERASLGILLRREGLYASSIMVCFRQAWVEENIFPPRTFFTNKYG